MGKARMPERARGGMTIVELVCAVGVMGLLIGLILPAVGHCREASRRLECSHRLRQIGLGLAQYEEAQRSLPAGWQAEASGRSAYGWATAQLGFTEQRALCRRLHRGRPLERRHK